MGISGIENLPKIMNVPGMENKATGSDITNNFADVLNNALNKVNDLQIESTNITESFINGETDNIHSVMIAGSKADLALQMTIQVRNKIMDAYNEIMNMQI